MCGTREGKEGGLFQNQEGILIWEWLYMFRTYMILEVEDVSCQEGLLLGGHVETGTCTGIICGMHKACVQSHLAIQLLG
jgi:hypothetical protein